MAIKAGQYVLIPALAGGAIGGAWGTGAYLGGEDVNVGSFATNGATIGAGLGASLWAYKGYKNFKVGNFTNPLNDVDTSKITPGTKKLLENLF